MPKNRKVNGLGVTQLNTISQAENHTVPVQNYPQLRKSYGQASPHLADVHFMLDQRKFRVLTFVKALQ
jgi:hypothetical protein